MRVRILLGRTVCRNWTPWNASTIYIHFDFNICSIDNKFGHTQKPEDTCGDNFHPDHHIYHMKNFGIYNSLMDMYFGTATNNSKYMVKPSLYYTDEKEVIFDVEKKIENQDTVFYFTPKQINNK